VLRGIDGPRETPVFESPKFVAETLRDVTFCGWYVGSENWNAVGPRPGPALEETANFREVKGISYLIFKKRS